MDYIALKKEHGAVCIVPIGHYEITFRPLTWQEADTYQKVLTMGLVPEGQLAAKMFSEICLDTALVDYMNSLPAGIIYTFFRVVLDLSSNPLQTEDHVNRFNEDLDILRSHCEGNPYESAIWMICKAFPSQSPQDIEVLPYYEILRMLIMAEKILDTETPFKIVTGKNKKKGLTDQIFEDARRAQGVDTSTPNNQNIKDVIEQKRENPHPGLNAAQQEAIRRAMEERRGMR